VNLCRSCRQDFNSVELFDRHRVGKHAYDWSPECEDGRRCLDANEMAALGWRLNARGRWVDPARAARAAQIESAEPTQAIKSEERTAA
jgi:hypothetical protein